MTIQSDNIDFVTLAQARLRDLKLYSGPINGRGGAATQAALQHALAPMIGNGRGTGGGAASQDLDNTDCVMLAQVHLQAMGMYGGPINGHGDAALQVILQRALSGPTLVEAEDAGGGGGIAPSITTPASASEVDGGATITYTFVPPVVAGNPTPTVARVLTLGGVDVTGAMSGNAYVATKTGATQPLVMTYTASNGVAPPATSTVSRTVPVAPVLTPVDLTAAAGSLGFPEGNNGAAAAVYTTFKGALTQNDVGLSIAATSAQAVFAILRLPQDKQTEIGAETYGVLGFPGTSAPLYRLRYYPWSGSSVDKGRFEWYCRGTSGGIITCKSEVVTEDNVLVAINSDASGNWTCDLYSLLTGTRIAGAVAGPFTNPAVANQGNNIGIGAVSGATGFTVNGGGGCWPGEIGAIGIVRRAVSVPEWQAIATGADIIATLGASNLHYLREFDGTPATFAKPAGATSDASSGPAEPWTGTTGVPASVQFPASTLRRQSAGQWLLMDQVSPGYVYGLTPGQTSRNVTFSGTAGGLTGNVEVRVFRADTGQIVRDWTSVGAISGGMWSGVLNLPRSSSWLFAQARSASTPSVIFHRREEFAVGWKFILLGQSQMSIAFDTALSGFAPVPAVPMLASWVTNDAGPVQMARIGMSFDGDGKRAFLNQFRVFDPNTPVMLIDEAINGTGMMMMTNSASSEGTNSNRNINQMIRKLTAVGNDVTAVIHQWGTTDLTTPTQFPDLLNSLFFGTGPLAGDRNIAAQLAPGWVPVISPLSRHTNRGGTTSARRGGVDWANAGNYVVGPPVSDMRIENSGGPHQNPGILMGALPLMSRLAIAAARAIGADTSQNPYFTTAALGAGNTTITIQTTRPNGGNLFSPAPTALRGFQVDNGGVGTWVNAAGNFAAAISGNTVVLTKSTGSWSAGTRVRFLSDGEDRADADGTAEDAIVAGTLYESWAGDVTMSRGLPVMGSLVSGKWVPDWNAVAA